MRGAACCRARTPAHALSETDTKTYDVQGLQLGVSALYNYGTHTPYAGFILESTSGVSSAAKSNSFSINQAFLLEDLPVETKIEMQARRGCRGFQRRADFRRERRRAGWRRARSFRGGRQAILLAHGAFDSTHVSAPSTCWSRPCTLISSRNKVTCAK